MLSDESKIFGKRLMGLYPDKFNPTQLSELIDGMKRYTLAEANAALDEWQRREQWPPTLAGLLKIVRARAESNGRQRRDTSFADILRSQHPENAQRSDAFVLWAYYRNIWRTGRKYVLAGYSRQTPERQAALKADIDARLAANTARFARELETSLHAHGYSAEWSSTVAGWLDADDVRELVDSLDGMRQEVAA